MAFIRRRTRGVSAGVFSFPVVVTCCEVYIRRGLCFVHAACRVLNIKESRVWYPCTDKIVTCESKDSETRYTGAIIGISTEPVTPTYFSSVNLSTGSCTVAVLVQCRVY